MAKALQLVTGRPARCGRAFYYGEYGGPRAELPGWAVQITKDFDWGNLPAAFYTHAPKAWIYE